MSWVGGRRVTLGCDGSAPCAVHDPDGPDRSCAPAPARSRSSRATRGRPRRDQHSSPGTWPADAAGTSAVHGATFEDLLAHPCRPVTSAATQTGSDASGALDPPSGTDRREHPGDHAGEQPRDEPAALVRREAAASEAPDGHQHQPPEDRCRDLQPPPGRDPGVGERPDQFGVEPCVSRAPAVGVRYRPPARHVILRRGDRQTSPILEGERPPPTGEVRVTRWRREQQALGEQRATAVVGHSAACGGRRRVQATPSSGPLTAAPGARRDRLVVGRCAWQGRHMLVRAASVHPSVATTTGASTCTRTRDAGGPSRR
jgi:hypothetical protein